ncbi:MAG: hypothetical protein HUK17_06075 [Bacteroidales bacterium]|nr:hypothetical protein [Bacteroidales bacterium]
MKNTTDTTLELPTFKSLDLEPIPEVFLIAQHATHAHCANMARLAREYGWAPRIFPLLMGTGLTQDDRQHIADAICQDRRLFCEEYVRKVLPNLPDFDSNILMAYAVEDTQNASGDNKSLSLAEIQIASLKQQIAILNDRIKDAATALEESRQTVRALREMIANMSLTTAKSKARKPQPESGPIPPEMMPMVEEQFRLQQEKIRQRQEQILHPQQAEAEQERAQSLAYLRSFFVEDKEFECFISEVKASTTTEHLVRVVFKKYLDNKVLNIGTIRSLHFCNDVLRFAPLAPPIMASTLTKYIRNYLNELYPPIDTIYN